MMVFEHGSRKKNKIALTFDDGPNPFFTRQILNLLDAFFVKANFFVLGANAERYPDIVKEIFDRGHLVGNHSYSHPKEGVLDFGKAEDIIFAITEKHTEFVRAPYLDVRRGANWEPAKTGAAKIINADVFPHIHLPKAKMVDFVIDNTQNGSIVLLHDGSRKQEEQKTRPAEMFTALPEIIKKLSDKFKFIRLDEMDFAQCEAL